MLPIASQNSFQQTPTPAVQWRLPDMGGLFGVIPSHPGSSRWRGHLPGSARGASLAPAAQRSARAIPPGPTADLPYGTGRRRSRGRATSRGHRGLAKSAHFCISLGVPRGGDGGRGHYLRYSRWSENLRVGAFPLSEEAATGPVASQNGGFTVCQVHRPKWAQAHRPRYRTHGAPVAGASGRNALR